jgi:hypothetical protein
VGVDVFYTKTNNSVRFGSVRRGFMAGHAIEYLDVDDATFQGIKQRLIDHGFDVPEGSEGEVRGREIVGKFAHDAANKRLRAEIIELPPSMTPGFISGWLHDRLYSQEAQQAAEQETEQAVEPK